jgi:hypothetical protein
VAKLSKAMSLRPVAAIFELLSGDSAEDK